MAHVDLHLHTTFSDGTLSPQALVTTAAERGVSLIAVTDHDEVGGVLPAQTMGPALGVNVISGVEINTEVGREDVHILGYGFPADSPINAEGLQGLRTSRLSRAFKMADRLAYLGYLLDRERLLAIAGHGSIGRPHIARALVEAGYVKDMTEAFTRLIGNRCPAYVPREPFAPEAAIALIHQAGGITSLAHPGKLGDPIRFLRRLKAVGLDALEAYHSDHPPATTERLLKWAHQFELAITGGTDSHGPDGPRVVAIGSVPVPDEIGAQFIALLQERTVS
jgi:predicted metal-dependent phosphoesterase TrpH